MKNKIISLFLLGVVLLVVGFILKFNSNSGGSKLIPQSVKEKEVKSVRDEKVKITSVKKLSEEIKVLEVIDGDTIKTTKNEEIRYIGINAPEKGQPYFEESQKLNKELVEGKVVKLELDVQSKDRYGRTLGYVYYVNESTKVFVNLEMVRRGLAVIQTIQPNVKYQDMLVKAEQDAREECLGIWSGLCANKSEDVLGNKSDSCIKIVSINADASGDDNKNKNEEWIEIRNICTEYKNMDGWLLKDSSASNEYIFKEFSINPGIIVKLHSGCGSDTEKELFWKCPEEKYAIWNNSGDHAFLYNEKGQLVSDYKY